MISRRTALKTGLLGGALLGAAGLVGRFAGRDADADRTGVLTALVPAMLDGALPAERKLADAAIARCVASVGTAIAGLSPQAQAELAQLFSLLSLPPGRLLLAGLAQPWPQADVADVRGALTRWREHPLALLQTAYQALHDLVLGAWYGDEANWAAMGYGGPIHL